MHARTVGKRSTWFRGHLILSLYSIKMTYLQPGKGMGRGWNSSAESRNVTTDMRDGEKSLPARRASRSRMLIREEISDFWEPI